MAKKLELEDKLEIILSRHESLRKIADSYKVHHSRIDDIYAEAKEALEVYWTEKAARIGRPPNAAPSQEAVELKKQLLEARKEADLKQIRIEFLELKLKWADEERAESKKKSGKHLKKSKKKR